MAKNEKKENKKAENNEGIHITPPVSNKKADKADVEMCILCEKKPAYKTATVDSDLCEECRQGFMYTPIRYSGIIALVLVFVIMISGILLVVPHAPTVKAVLNTYKNINADLKDTALDEISGSANQTSMGWKTASSLAKFCYSINLPDDLTFLTEEFFYYETEDTKLNWQDKVGKGNLNASWNKELKAKYDYQILLQKIDTEKSVIFKDYYAQYQSGKIEAKDIPYEEIISKYQTELAKSTSNEEKGIISYYMLATSNICDKDTKIQLKYCQDVAKYIPDCYRLYIDNLITLSIIEGEYTQAEKYINILSNSNITDKYYAKSYTAMMYRYQNKYDAALLILKEIIADVENNEMYDAFYDALLCELLKGNLDAAYEYAKQCVDNEYYLSYSALNIYALLSKHFGNEEGYTHASKIFEQYGTKISPTVDKYLKGEITIKDLIKNGEVVFE